MDPDLMGPSLSAIEGIADHIDGIVVTNLFGYQSRVLEYETWCKRNGKLLLQDNAATPVGYLSDGRCIHDVGDGSFLSLHETKPLGRGEGGAVFVNSPMIPFVDRAINFGFNTLSVERVPHRFASNWRMSDFSAAPICDHLDNVVRENWVEVHEKLLSYAISQVELVGFRVDPKPLFPTLASCLFVRLPKESTDASLDDVISYLNKCTPSIEAKRYYRPLCSREEGPVAWNIFCTSICLPCHTGLTKEMIQYAVNSLRFAHDIFCAGC
jgi:dTDP-4-amino-4,6-dideoxygalactose transaminase